MTNNEIIDQNKYYIKNDRGTNAYMTVSNDKYLVLKESKIAHNIVASICSSYREQLKIFENDGTIVNFKFTKDYSFNSPSYAASIVAGNQLNGWDAWKNIITNESLDNIRTSLNPDEEIIDENIDNIIHKNKEESENKWKWPSEAALRDFMVTNWKLTVFGKDYDIYGENGEIVGVEFRTDTDRRIDILAISKDMKKFLVIELKVHKTGDQVIGQTQNYMGYTKRALAIHDEIVEGAIVVPENNQNLQDAISMTNNIKVYKFTMGDLNFEQLY